MGNIEQFAKNEKELETLIQVETRYSNDIGMKFAIEKYAMLIMKSGKQQMTEELELLNQGKIKILGGKETYKYLRISEADAIKLVKMKEKN